MTMGENEKEQIQLDEIVKIKTRRTKVMVDITMQTTEW